jgi:CRISPR-associated protein Csm5
MLKTAFCGGESMSYLKQYRLKIRTLSPVFIGSGKRLTKKEYLYIPRTQEIIFVDTRKLFDLLESKQLSGAYEDFIMGGQKNLYDWLQTQHLTQREIRSIGSYSIHAGNALETSSNFRLTGIELFIKDANNRPFLPGSSVKGVIRTAILAQMTERNDYSSRLPNYRDSIRRNRRTYILSKESKEVETECLHTLALTDKRGREIPRQNAVNSIMKGLEISDSMPLECSSLTLCAKVDVGTSGFPKKLPIARECIRPGVTAKHVLTLDTRVLEKAGIDVSAVLSAIRRFYQIQHQYFLSKFAKVQEMDHTPSNGYELFLGGGTGFVSKSLLYPMLKEKGLDLTSELMTKQFRGHHHERDRERGVSPHMLKCTKYDNKVYLMGRCEVTIE